MKLLFNIKKYLFLFVFSILTCLSLVANASNLGVNPINVIINSKTNISSLKITNQDTKQATTKISIMKWEQKNGKDIYTPSNDLIVTPPIAKVSAQNFQLLRIGLAKPRNMNQETSYRLFINELASKTKEAKTEIAFALNISLPVFVKPAQENRDLNWSVKQLNTKDVVVNLTNKGNVHAKISKLQLFQVNQDKPVVEKNVFTYVLPKQQASWQLKSTQVLSGSYRLVAITDNGEVSENIVVSQ